MDPERTSLLSALPDICIWLLQGVDSDRIYDASSTLTDPEHRERHPPSHASTQGLRDA